MSEQANVGLNGSTLGTGLQSLLMADDIAPGSEPSYEICKTIFLYHPLGQKMAEAPIKMAQFAPRIVSINNGLEDDLKKAFEDQWNRDGITFIIRNVATLARVYGIASVALVEENVRPATPLDPKTLGKAEIAFNVLDPLNTSGSLVLNQDPNAIDFQKHKDISVSGTRYHRSRTVTLMNEQPIYIHYTSSAFGFVGRSVYQRALYPLKSYIRTMITDDMIARKAGIIVATLKQASSIIDNVMNAAAGFKRNILKIAATDNVINVGEGETITSIDLTNVDGAAITARKNILENIASAADMPAKLLNQETFAEGFSDGTEDANAIASYIDQIRLWLLPLYFFFDMVTQRRAWSEDFFKSLQSKYTELKKKSYDECFYEWSNSFTTQWPSLIREPESEKVKVADVKLKAVIAAIQVFLPELDPANKVIVLMWAQDQLNNTSELFGTELILDGDSLEEFSEENAEAARKMTEAGESDEGGEGSGELKEPKPNKPFSASDSFDRSPLAAYLGASNDDSDMAQKIVRLEGAIGKIISRKAGRR